MSATNPKSVPRDPVSESDPNIHAAVEVHSVDTNRWIILDAQIDMFADAETEIARL